MWDVPDVLSELHESWPFICGVLRTPNDAGDVDPLDYVLCGDPGVAMRLHVLSLVFRAREYSGIIYFVCLVRAANSVLRVGGVVLVCKLRVKRVHNSYLLFCFSSDRVPVEF